MIDPNAHLRIARPSRDLEAAERFYVDGLGFKVLQRGRGTSTGERDLLMVGLSGAAWHIELIHDTARTVEPVVTPDDLLAAFGIEHLCAFLIVADRMCHQYATLILAFMIDDWPDRGR